MTAGSSEEFERLVELARTSAGTLLAAGKAPQSSPLRGWLVIQRLDRIEIEHAPRDGGTPRRHETFYEQIWLTAGGELRCATRVHGSYCDWTAGAPSAMLVPDTDVTRPGALIASPDDIGSRWDGDHGPTKSRHASVETIVHDRPSGPREDPAARIAAALQRMTSWLLEGERLTRPAPSRERFPSELKVLAAFAASVAVLFATALLLWDVFVEQVFGG